MDINVNKTILTKNSYIFFILLPQYAFQNYVS